MGIFLHSTVNKGARVFMSTHSALVLTKSTIFYGEIKHLVNY